MKKVFLFIVLSVFAFTSFSQVKEINGKTYILPDAIFNGCVEFDFPDSLTASLDTIISYYFWGDGNHYYNNYFYNYSEFAQLFHTDDSANVIGIAGYMNTHPYAFLMNNYLGIGDTSFNILEEKVLSDTLMSNGYRFPSFELIFDNPVNVIGDFYVITDFAKPSKYNKDGVLYEDTLNNKYNWEVNPMAYDYKYLGINIPYIRNDKPCTRQTVMFRRVHYYGGGK